MQYLAAWYSLVVYLSFFTPLSKQYKKIAKSFKEGIFVLAFLAYLFASNFALDFELLKISVYFIVVILFLRLSKYFPKNEFLFQFLAVLSLWLAIEFDWLPEQYGLLAAGIPVPLSALIGLLLLLFAFRIVYPLEDMGVSFALGFKDIAFAMIGVLAFAIIGLPLGMMINFLNFNFVSPDIASLASGLIFGYLFVALAEEILFRGVIQNLFYTVFSNKFIALATASIIFGLSHINNKTAGFSTPNWGFVLLATIAGFCYGGVYLKTKKVTAAAITHLFVNLIWLLFFAT